MALDYLLSAKLRLLPPTNVKQVIDSLNSSLARGIKVTPKFDVSNLKQKLQTPVKVTVNFDVRDLKAKLSEKTFRVKPEFNIGFLKEKIKEYKPTVKIAKFNVSALQENLYDKADRLKVKIGKFFVHGLNKDLAAFKTAHVKINSFNVSKIRSALRAIGPDTTVNIGKFTVGNLKGSLRTALKGVRPVLRFDLSNLRTQLDKIPNKVIKLRFDITSLRNALDRLQNKGVNIKLNPGRGSGGGGGNPLNGKYSLEKFGEQAARSVLRYGAFAVAAGSIYKFVTAIKDGVDNALDFEKEMIRLSQVTGLTQESLKPISDEITRLATTFGVSSKELTQVSITLAQAGLSAQDTKTALEALAKTGVSATFDDINNTTEASIAIMAQFGKQASDLEGILGSINAVSAKYAVESSDITAAVRKAGAAFAATGGNINEFIALFTSVRATTRESADTIATGFRTIFTRLQKVSTQGFFKSLGIELRDMNGQFIGGYEAIRRISEALKDIPTTDVRFSKIVEELGGFRQVNKVIPLLTKFTLSEEALNVALRGTNSLSEDAAKAQEGMLNQLTRVKEEFLALVKAIAATDTFKSLVHGIVTVTHSLIQLIDTMKPLIPMLGLLAAFKLGTGLSQIFGKQGFQQHIPFFAEGGQVGGVGNKDNVPAMLMPGEYVLNKKAVSKIGVNTLDKVNDGVQHFAKGGLVSGLGTLGGSPIALGLLIASMGGLTDQIAGLKGSLTGYTDKISSVLFKVALAIAAGKAVGNKSGGFGERTRNYGYTPNFSDRFTKNYAAIGRTGLYLNNNQRNQMALDQSYNLGINPFYSTPKGGNFRENYRYYRQAGASREGAGAAARSAVVRSGIRKFGGPLAGVGISELGNYLHGQANENIQKGQDSTLQAGIGGSLSAAGTGAAIGFAAGGPLGAAIGGAVGAVTGFITSLKAAKKELESVKLNKSFDDFEKLLASSKISKLDAQINSGTISNYLKAAPIDLANADDKNKADILGRFQGSSQDIQAFFKQIASGSKTFDEFDTKTNGALKQFAFLSKIPYSSLEKEFKNLIEATQKQVTVQKELDNLVDSETRAIIQLDAFGQAVEEVSTRFNALDTILNSYKDRLSGNISKGSVSDVGDRLDAAQKGRIRNPEALNKIGGTLLSPFGEIGKDIQKQFVGSSQAISKLPLLLLKLRNEGELSDSGDIEKRFSDALQEFGPEVADKLKAGLSKKLGPNQDTEKLFTDISENPFAVAEEIGKGLNDVFEQLKSLAPEIKKQKERTSEAFDLYADSVIKAKDYIDKQTKIKNTLGEDLDKIRDIHRDPLQTIGEERRRVSAIGGSSDPAILAATLKTSGERITAIQSKLAAPDVGLQEQEDLSRELAKQKVDYEQARKALEDVADSGRELAAVHEDLAKQEEKRKVKSSVLETLLFGSRKEKIQLGKNIGNANRLGRYGAGALIGVSDEDKSSLKGFIEQLNGAKLNIGGQKSQDVYDNALAQVGLGIGLDANTVKGIVKPGESEQAKKDIELLKEISDRQVSALDGLKSEFERVGQNAADLISKQNKDFLSALDQTLRNNLAGQIGIGKAEEEGKLAKNQAQLDTVAKFEQAVGAKPGSLNPKDVKDYISGVKSNQELDKVKEEKSKPFKEALQQAGNLANLSGGDLDAALNDISGKTGVDLSKYIKSGLRKEEFTVGGSGTRFVPDEQSKAKQIAEIYQKIEEQAQSQLGPTINSKMAGEIALRKSAVGSLVKTPEQASSLLKTFGSAASNLGDKPTADILRDNDISKSRIQGYNNQIENVNKGRSAGPLFPEAKTQNAADLPVQGQILDSNKFGAVVQNLSAASNQMSEAFSQIPTEITLTATHNVNVVFNGAEILSSLEPGIRDMAVAQAKDQINKLIESKFPTVGNVA